MQKIKRSCRGRMVRGWQIGKRPHLLRWMDVADSKLFGSYQTEIVKWRKNIWIHFRRSDNGILYGKAKTRSGYRRVRATRARRTQNRKEMRDDWKYGAYSCRKGQTETERSTEIIHVTGINDTTTVLEKSCDEIKRYFRSWGGRLWCEEEVYCINVHEDERKRMT